MSTRKTNNLGAFVVLALSLFFMAGLVSANSIPSYLYRSGPNPSTSFNWSGYATTSSADQFSAVASTWTIPTVSATTTQAADATWVGIGGISNQDLIQAGTQAVINNGQTTYQAWYEMLPQAQQIIPITVNAGDSVSVSLNETSLGSGQWTLAFHDNTNGQSYSTNLSYTSSHSSAEWIEEMPTATGNSSYVPLDNFGTVNFSAASTTINGTAMNIAQTGAGSLTMINGGNQELATPSSIGSDGASFSVARSANSPYYSYTYPNYYPTNYYPYGTTTYPYYYPNASSTYPYRFMNRGGWHRTGVGIQGFSHWNYNNNGNQNGWYHQENGQPAQKPVSQVGQPRYKIMPNGQYGLTSYNGRVNILNNLAHLRFSFLRR